MSNHGLCPREARLSLTRVEERDAIEQYNRAGDVLRGGFNAVHWPDIALTPANLARLAEGVLDARVDLVRAAFGDDFDAAACGDRLAEAWRVDEVQLRYAPEGVFVRGAFTVRVTLAPEPDDPDSESAEAMLRVRAELCVSFTDRHHTRPMVDFMGGEVRHDEPEAMARRIDPFAVEISPVAAITWGLNEPSDAGGRP